MTLKNHRIPKTQKLPSIRAKDADKGTEVWVHQPNGEHYSVQPAVILDRHRHNASVRFVLTGDKAVIRYAKMALRVGDAYELVEPEESAPPQVKHPPVPRMPVVHTRRAPAPPPPKYTHQESPVTNSPHIEYPSGLQLNETAIVIGRASSKNDSQRKVDRYAYVVITDAEQRMTVRTIARRRDRQWEPAASRKHVTSLPAVAPILLLTSLQDYGDVLDVALRDILQNAYLDLYAEIDEERSREKVEKTRAEVQKKVSTLTDEQLIKLAALLDQ